MMNGKMRFLLATLCVFTVAVVCCVGQTSPAASRSMRSEAAARVASIKGQLNSLTQGPNGEQELLAELPTACRKPDKRCSAVREGLRQFSEQRIAAADRLAMAVHREVDRHLASLRIANPADIDLEFVKAELQAVLQLPADMLPMVMSTQQSGEPHVVVAYCLHKGSMMGPGMTSVALRAYRLQNGRLELHSDAGREMAGYTWISVLPVPLQEANQAWFLLSGYLTGANGPNLRMRGYLYGQHGFQMLWAPANVWARLTLNPWENGFRVDGNSYRTDAVVHEFYRVSEHAVYQDRSTGVE